MSGINLLGCCCTPPDPNGKWHPTISVTRGVGLVQGSCCIDHNCNSFYTNDHDGLAVTVLTPQPEPAKYCEVHVGVWSALNLCQSKWPLAYYDGGHVPAGWREVLVTVPKEIIKDPDAGVTVNITLGGNLDDTLFPATCYNCPPYQSPTKLYDPHGQDSDQLWVRDRGAETTWTQSYGTTPSTNVGCSPLMDPLYACSSCTNCNPPPESVVGKTPAGVVSKHLICDPTYGARLSLMYVRGDVSAFTINGGTIEGPTGSWAVMRRRQVWYNGGWALQTYEKPRIDPSYISLKISVAGLK